MRSGFRRFIAGFLILALVAAAGYMTISTVKADSQKHEIATIVKLSGVAWFDRMKQGVQQFADNTGHDAFQVGPAKADNALQVKMINDMIARGVDAIAIVPFSVKGVEPALKKARDKGIVVIGHEGRNLKNIDYDIEAFDNKAFGARLMDRLAKEMGKDGKYAAMVGSLQSKTHNQWVDGGIERQKEKYPEMELVTDRVETEDNKNKAYEATRQLIKKFPELEGIQGSASTDAPGAGQAIEELGLHDEIQVVGTSLPSISGQYIETGAVDAIGFWDPKLAGIAMNKIAARVLDDKAVEDGMDLGIDGYHDVTKQGKVLMGNGSVIVDKSNMDKYPF